MTTQPDNRIRIDKWLWAARFFKTRSLASEAIKGGKIHVNGHRCKPSHVVTEGQEVRIRKTGFEISVVVKIVSDKRGPATLAQTYYEETQASQELRDKRAEERKNMVTAESAGPMRRPNKKDRRKIVKFKQGLE